MSLKRLVFVLSIISMLLAGCGGEERQCGPTCCVRTIGWGPIDMPDGQVRDLNRILDASFFSGLLTSAVHSKCPTVEFHDMKLKRLNMEWVNKILEVYGDIPAPPPVGLSQAASEFDYIFIPSLSVSASGFDPENGDLLGQYTLHVQLVDQHHGGVVQDGSASWSVTTDGIAASRDMIQAVKSLGESFVPIDKILCDYERLPESVEVEVDKEKVGVGEEITINLTEIFDYDQRPASGWWRVLVKVDKGEITNADAEIDGFSIFRVQGGAIDVEYQAPEMCPGEDKSETIKVHNTCVMREGSNCPPEKKIAESKFEILCDMELEFTYWQVADFEGLHDEQGYTGRVSFSVDYGVNPPTLEGEGEIEITGSGGAGDCKWTHRGVIDVTLSGHMEREGSAEPRLIITEEMVSKWHTIEGNVEGCMGGQLFPITLTPTEHDFPLEDEHTIEWDFNMLMVKGEASRILHVP